MFFTTRLVSSLEKVFCSPELPAEKIESVSGACGETVAFQLACRGDENYIIEIQADSEIAELLTMREVGLVPCLMPSMPDDPYVLTHKAGVFPDPLLPMKKNRMRLSRGNWHAVWCSIRIPEDMKAGTYEIRFTVTMPETPFSPPGTLHHAASVSVEVLPFRLPEQKLLSVNWFYADCVQAYYRVPCWSERHWELLEQYFRNMVRHGNNVILTPLWSVPLDTAVGHERPTAQLLDISFADGVSALESAIGVEFIWENDNVSGGMPAFDKTFFDRVFVTADGAVSENAEQYNKLVAALSSGVTLFEAEVFTAGDYGTKTDVYEIKIVSDGLKIRVEGMELDDTNIIF